LATHKEHSLNSKERSWGNKWYYYENKFCNASAGGYYSYQWVLKM